jgi:glycosyltransferase involved in cell wall biosynthesis
MPEISVVIPSYNHAAYISEAVNSVLAQTEPDFELIVVDDGSTDNTLEVLSGFSDARLEVLPQSNQGAHAAINRGLGEASGRYLAILNSDDAYHPRRLENVLAVFGADPQVGLVGSYIEIIDAQGKSLGVKHGYQDCQPWLLEAPERSFRAGSDLRAALLTENYWSTTSNYVFPRALYEQAGAFRPLRYVHDWDFALRLAKIAPLVLLPEPLVRYRVHPTNTIRENQAVMIFEICWLLAVHLPEHIADPGFFNRLPLETRIEQLLHSIYAFGVDRVLSVMLLQDLHANPEQAQQLLEPGNPAREKYLQYIYAAIGKAGETPQPAATGRGSNQAGYLGRLKAGLRRIYSRLIR